jgi:hypothetical protein
MSEVKNVPGILDVIKSITANRESGRLEISSPGMHGAGTHSSGTHGVLLFTEGKLVDARLESLSGFQAVNAAIALRDVEFNFDHVVPAPHAVSITPSERVVLKQFFGIEAAEMEEPTELVEPDPGWNETPEQVVPLAEVEELPQTDLEETPTVEVEAVRSAPLFNAQPSGDVREPGSTRKFAFRLRPQVAIGLVLLLGLVFGAVTLRSKFKARQEAETAGASVSEPRPVTDTEAEVSQAPIESPVASVPQSQNPVHDLNGEWRLINTIEKTDYTSFHNLQLGFRLKINQTGKDFTATGEKFSENGQTLPAGSRTPIQLTGSIEGDKVIATFVEDGLRRRSNGRFVWKLQSGGDRLTGTFVSTAANNRGRSAVTKEQ